MLGAGFNPPPDPYPETERSQDSAKKCHERTIRVDKEKPNIETPFHCHLQSTIQVKKGKKLSHRKGCGRTHQSPLLLVCYTFKEAASIMKVSCPRYNKKRKGIREIKAIPGNDGSDIHT